MRLIGLLLVTLSALAVVQTVREIVLETRGVERYAEVNLQDPAIAFGGHTFRVRDDRPSVRTDPEHTEDEIPGTIWLLLDGQPLGKPSLARVRPGRTDIGRYHLWLSASIFQERATGEASLWVARRIQPDSASTPQFEVVTVTTGGDVSTRTVRGWRLGSEYRLYRSTQLLADGEWTAFPLALGGIAGLLPPVLLLFPLGSGILGAWLLRKSRRRGTAVPV